MTKLNLSRADPSNPLPKASVSENRHQTGFRCRRRRRRRRLSKHLTSPNQHFASSSFLHLQTTNLTLFSPFHLNTFILTPPIPPLLLLRRLFIFCVLAIGKEHEAFPVTYNAGGGRRSNRLRSAHPPPPGVVEGVFRSPAALFWLALHAVCCVIRLLLDFRFSRLPFSSSSPTPLPPPPPLPSSPSPSPRRSSRRIGRRAGVVVGRHGIRVRPWPRPNPAKVIKAHRLMEVVQREQRVQYGVKSRRPLIVVTPTHVRTFQALHLTGLAHTLMLLPYDLSWVVVEAGGLTNETL